MIIVQDIHQQSEATCTALDMMLAGRHPALGTCTRNSLCTMITCVTSLGTINAITILPCTNPISVRFRVTSNFIMGFDRVFTESGTVATTATSSDIIMLTQIDGGIRFGVSR